MVHNFPPLLSSELNDPHDDITLPRLIEALQNRHSIRQRMIEEYGEAAGVIKSLLQLDGKLHSQDSLIHEQNDKLAEKDRIIKNNQAEIERLEKIIMMQELKIDILQKATKIYEENKRCLQQELELREHQLQREVSDKKRMEQRLNGVVTDFQLKWEKECERRVNVVLLEMQNNLRLKDEKLKQLRAIVESETVREYPPHQMQPFGEGLTEQNLMSSTPLLSPVGYPGLRPRSDSASSVEQDESDSSPASPILIPSTRSCMSEARCSSACEQQGAPESHSPPTPTRIKFCACFSARRRRSRAGCWTTGKDEPNASTLKRNERSNKEGQMVFTHQFVCDFEITQKVKFKSNSNLMDEFVILQLTTHPNSYLLPVLQRETPVRPLHQRFAGGKKWMDHRPSSSLDLGTVLQPVIPDAIQVSSPSKKALSKCDRYVLTHQEVASDGEIKTTYIKGEVIKTRGGGQAVQFTDIETLKLKLTTVPSHKRKSDENYTDGTDVETQCSVALETRLR